jgi:hypothetical protein
VGAERAASVLQHAIVPENRASIALYQSAGFRTLVVGRERAGQHHGVWRDTVFLERRRSADQARIATRRYAGGRLRSSQPAANPRSLIRGQARPGHRPWASRRARGAT